jgi:probable F420-dependent oxidoreductase
VATLNPRFYQPWEAEAGADAIAAIAETADRLGYHHVTASEHVAIAEDKARLRGTVYWDPAALLGFLAARTRRLRLATHIVVLGFHHPLAIAKRYATVDRVSDGRLILGVGVGSAEEEFQLLGAPLERRGARADDCIRALRASLSTTRPSYSGEFYSYSGWIMEPCAVQERVPIWIGGRSPRSLRRAVELADGWAPQGARHEEFADMLAAARESEAWARRTEPLEVVLTPSPSVDPSERGAEVAASIARLAELGATMINARMPHRSLTHCLEQLEAFKAAALESGVAEFD